MVRLKWTGCFRGVKKDKSYFQISGFCQIPGVSVSAELLLSQGSDHGGQLVVGVAGGGVDLAQVLEELGDQLLLLGAVALGGGHDVADEHLAAVGHVGGGDGVEEGSERKLLLGEGVQGVVHGPAAATAGASAVEEKQMMKKVTLLLKHDNDKKGPQGTMKNKERNS